MRLHEILDIDYGPDGDRKLREMLAEGADPETRSGDFEETALHVATRRRRLSAVEILLDHGATIDAETRGGKTAYAHAARRGFDEVADLLAQRGASAQLGPADRFAIAMVQGRLADARQILETHPEVARTGNPEDDRLLADLAGRFETEPVALLIEVGADLAAPGLDDGSPLHQAAWFGQPENARLLIEAGAPIDIFDSVHASSPIGWVTHGSRYSGGAETREKVYVELARLLLEAGCRLHYPGEPDDDAYFRRLLADASPGVREVLEAGRHGSGGQ